MHQVHYGHSLRTAAFVIFFRAFARKDRLKIEILLTCI